MKILFYSPHAAIWEHAYPEALIADILNVKSNTVTYITCGEVFKGYCIPMNAVGLSATADIKEKQAVCNQCQSNNSLIRQKFSLAGYDLKEVLSDAESEEIKKIFSQINRNNFIDLKIDGIEIGRIALFDFLLITKKISLDFTEDEWQSYMISLNNCLISFLGCKKILEREKPDRIIMYNTLYSVNQIAKSLAEQANIPVYLLHAGENISNRLSTMIIARGVTFDYRKELIAHWPAYRDRCFESSEYSKITDHFLEVMGGKHFLTYSAPKNKTNISIRSKFNIPKNAKILTATMSSYDERYAAETVGALPMYKDLIFPLQANWIESLIDYVKGNDNLFLIIRVHPREFPNKREKTKSEHAVQLENIFHELPINVAVNWPQDQLSLYNLAEETDVFLNSWSSAGEEMTFLGIPVVIYSDELVLYPSDLNYLGHDKDDYFQKIEQALKDGWNFERIRTAYRWYILRFSKAVINFQASFDPIKRPKIVQLSNKILNKLSIKHRNLILKKHDCNAKTSHHNQETFQLVNNLLLNKFKTLLESKHENDKQKVTLDEETLIIKHEIKRLYKKMYNLSENNTDTQKLRYNFYMNIKEDL